MSTDLPVICIMGPTASGKTALALNLVREFPCEIISVDSAMVYRDMNIGTAKPTQAELASVPHHLIDLCDPTEAYSAGRFHEDALQSIASIRQKNKIPLLVGGTMLYFHILQQGVAVLPTADDQIRANLMRLAEEHGWSAMHERLTCLDPKAAAHIHPNDAQRIQRALEVYEITGKTMSDLQERDAQTFVPYPLLSLALIPEDRGILHQRIAERFHQMLALGLVEEVLQLQQKYHLNADMPSMRAVGYRQVWQYLKGEYDYSEMEERGIIATRQLAKRQLTWLRSWPNLKSFSCEEVDLHPRIAAYLKQEMN